MFKLFMIFGWDSFYFISDWLKKLTTHLLNSQMNPSSVENVNFLQDLIKHWELIRQNTIVQVSIPSIVIQQMERRIDRNRNKIQWLVWPYFKPTLLHILPSLPLGPKPITSPLKSFLVEQKSSKIGCHFRK